MLVGLQITPRLCWKTNHLPFNTITEGFRENFNKLCFIELSQNILRVAVVISLVKKVANVQNFLN